MIRVAHQQQQHFTHVDQRRPTRFGGAQCQLQRANAATSSSSGATSSSRLMKCSTISRVPPANKSRLKQPVASGALVLSAAGPPPGEKQQVAKLRPASLALRPPSKVAPATSSAKAPGGLAKSKTTTTSIEIRSASGGPTKQRIGQPPPPPTGRRPNINTSRQTTANKASVGLESRLSGLKSLVAVVHPQHSQRVNSNTATATINNNSGSKLNLRPSVSGGNNKFEGGKANKDGNGSKERQRESERTQNGCGQVASTPTARQPSHRIVDNNGLDQIGQTGAGDLALTSTSEPYGVSQVVAVQSRKQNKHLFGFALHQDQPTRRRLGGACYKEETATCLKRPSSNSNINSVASRSHHRPINDRLQPKPMGHQVLSLMMLDVGLQPTTSPSPSEQQQAYSANYEQQQQQQMLLASKRSHVRMRASSSLSHGDEEEDDDDEEVEDESFDVGCQQQQSVSLVHHDNYDDGERDSVNNCLVRLSNNIICNGNSTNSSITTTSTNNSAIDYQASFEQSNNYHSFQSNEAHEMLRLQVRLPNQDNESFRSISLPCSPCSTNGVRAHRNQRRGPTKTIESPLSLRNGSCGPQNVAHRQSSSLIERLKCLPQAIRSKLHSGNSVAGVGGGNQQSQPTLAIGGDGHGLVVVDQLQSHLLQVSGDNQDFSSITSSSCSSLNLEHHQPCPPLLALSNQLNGLKFDELVSKVTASSLNLAPSKHKQQQQQNGNNLEQAGGQHQNQSDIIQSLDGQVAQVAKQHTGLLTSGQADLDSKIEKNHSNKIDHAKAALARDQSSLLIERDRSIVLEREEHQILTSLSSLSPKVAASSLNGNGLTQEVRGESLADHQLRRQTQSRSHSISGQDFHSNGQYQRLKQSLFMQHHQNGLLDQGYQNYNPHQVQTSHRTHQIPSPVPYQQQHLHHHQQQQLMGRSPSPRSVSSQPSNYSSHLRDHGSTIKYPPDRLARNQFHSSLECLNVSHMEDSEQTQQKLQEHHQQQQEANQQVQHLQNQHYAANYVLMQPPNNTQINQNRDQDLAAAAMGPPPSQYQSNPIGTTANLTNYSHQTQNLINRAMAQVSQGSPLRRFGMNGGANSSNNNSGASSGVLGHLSSLHHPMRAGHSSLSLASPSFIIEDKLQNEIKKLQSELKSEKEKNEALNSQLNINSNLMAAFEQSLTTLNTRLRQLTTLNEKKDNEIGELKEQLKCSKLNGGVKSESRDGCENGTSQTDDQWNMDFCESGNQRNSTGEQEQQHLLKTVLDLKKQLIEKDRLLTDTRLEALSAAHQLEQLEAKINGEQSLMVHEDELDEGVMVVNHSPSDSEQFSEINSQITTKNNHEV